MFRSKRDLDNHVIHTLSQITSEQEKILKCLGFARHYYSLREFETARRYLEDYLKSDAPNLDVAHKLMGDVLVELNRQEEALEQYKKSYELSKSRDVLNKICSLLQNGYGQNETPHSRTNWLNLQRGASSLQFDTPSSKSSYPSSPALLNVSISNTPKPILYSGLASPLPGSNSPRSNMTPKKAVSGVGLFSSFASPAMNQNRLQKGTALKTQVEDIGENLTKLVESNKATIHHHTTLLQFYLTDKKYQEATNHVHRFMLKFGSNFDFLQKSVEVMEEAIQQDQKIGKQQLSEAELYSAYFFVLENYIGLLLDLNLKDVIPEAVGDKRISLAAQNLHKFDQLLLVKGRKVKFSPLESWWPLFLKHCKAQLTFFMGILLQIRSEKDGKHPDLFQSCFTFASGFVIDQPLSMIKLREPKLQQRAFIECCYRLIVTHRLLAEVKTPTFTTELKDLIYERCFPNLGLKVTSEFLSIVKLEFSSKGENLQGGTLSDEKFWLYVKVAQLLYPDSLHHQAWLQSQALERLPQDPPILHSVPFEETPVTPNSNRNDADSISQQDVDTFLTISTLIVTEPFSNLLPHLTTEIFSSTQLKFWSCAYKFTHGISNGSEWATTENRLEVQRGLEMIRSVENTLPPSLISITAGAFTQSALMLEETSSAKQFLHLSVPPVTLHKAYFNAAELYSKMFVESVLETEAPKKRTHFWRFFDVRSFPILPNPAASLERARYILGWRAMENRDFESALNFFEQTSFPESSLFCAEMYKILADEELDVNADSGIKYKALLEQAKELLYETLSRKDKRPNDYLLGKSNVDSCRAPLPHPKLDNEGEVIEMIDEVEAKLREIATLNVSFGNGSPFKLNGFSSILDEIADENQSLEESPEKISPVRKSPVIAPVTSGKGRRSLREQVLLASTPRKLDDDFAMDEEITWQAAVQFGDTLEKILEQNSVILDTISQMEDEIKDLNDRVEMLKKARKFNRRKNVTFSVAGMSG